MRLICPNCDAQYEVDEAVIPAEGRDVQCSSCSHTWFQKSAQALRAEAEAETRAAAEEPDEAPPAPAAPEGLKRRELDPSVLDVLREEASRETEARKAEGASLEVQTDLGLTAPPPAPPAPESAPQPEAPEIDPALVPRPSRRELLPDIEEINSTLRATSERDGDAAAMDAPETLRQRRSGFRKGFVAAVGLMVGLLLPYLFAAPLANAVPATGPALTAYADAIDGLRLGLEDFVRGLIQSIGTDSTNG